MRLNDWVKLASQRFAERFDTSYTALFSGQLEHIMAEAYNVEYPELRSKTFFPTDHSTPTGAETVSYKQFNMYGSSAVGGNYSDDIPLVNVDGIKFTNRIVPIKIAYEISVQDLRSAAMANMPLQATLVNTAMRVVEQTIDNIAAFGNAEYGLSGFLNHGSIPANDAETGGWATADPDVIIADILNLWHSIPTETKQVHYPNRLLVPTVVWGQLHRRLTDTPLTIKEYLLKTLQNCQSIDQWSLLDTAGAGGTPRLLAYEQSPRTGVIDIPQEFEMFAPQENNLAFIVPCHARCGGAKIFYPLAYSYLDASQ